MTRRIALVVGDTLGHFYPALAVAEHFVRANADARVVMIGPRDGIAATLAAQHGYPYASVDSTPWPDAGLGSRAAATRDALRGMWQARRALKRHDSQLVIGFGGHATGVVVLAARSLGLFTAIHEANVAPGRANRWIARVAHRVHLQFAAASSSFPRARCRVTGWPVRASIAALARTTRTPPARDRALNVLVLEGASRESDFLARRVPALLAALVNDGWPVNVWHQHAVADGAALAAEYQSGGLEARVEPFVEPVAEAYAWADFVIARAGGGVLAEVAIAGVPSLMVPLSDAADDHQARNAHFVSASGACLWSREETWNQAALSATIIDLLRDRERWTAMSAAARRLATPDAASLVVADCEASMRRGW